MDVRTQIEAELERIEREQGVCIVYACESGSRAWGFESSDSDYDVRFLYVHPTEWYLRVVPGREVIEKPIDGLLDISGWDLRKALQLLRKSNPPLLEWLQSPIVYREHSNVVHRIRDLMPQYYQPVACHYHYLHMARGNYREFLQGDTVWLKKYFYVLRPVLACLWIERDYGVVPIQFQMLVERVLEDGQIKTAIQDLIRRKKAGEELERRASHFRALGFSRAGGGPLVSAPGSPGHAHIPSRARSSVPPVSDQYLRQRQGALSASF